MLFFSINCFYLVADASGKIPGGILEGTTMDFGSYEECLKIRVYSDDEVENFRGRYCMVGYQSPLLTSIHEKSFLDDKEKYAETYGKPPEWVSKASLYLKNCEEFLQKLHTPPRA